MVRRKPNPVLNLSRVRPPRNSFSFDGSRLHATIFVPVSTTASSEGTDHQQLGTDSSFSPARVMNSMVRQYREYRYHKVTLQWIPSVGPASADAGARVFLAYVDNPEQMFNFQTSTAPLNTTALKVPYVKNNRNVLAFNAWERITWNVPLTRRRPWFDVNTAESAYTVDVFDRCVQGQIVQAYQSPSVAVVLGTVKITFDIELRGLNTDVGAIV